jgi:hypothetical protein
MASETREAGFVVLATCSLYERIICVAAWDILASFCCSLLWRKSVSTIFMCPRVLTV